MYDTSIRFAQVWVVLVFSIFPARLPAQGFEEAIALLRSTETGARVFENARESLGFSKEDEIFSALEWGPVSKTDATLTRAFNPLTGLENRSRSILISIRLEQPMGEIVLDLVHELVHAGSRPIWDPYDPELTPTRYITISIEGPGGEIDALEAECRVAYDLETRIGHKIKRCERYRVPGSQGVDRERMTTDFYKVGHWITLLTSELGDSELLPSLLSEKPELFSSTGNAPYPVALYEEFLEMTRAACRNTERRLATVSTAGKNASGLRRFLSRRCRTLWP